MKYILNPRTQKFILNALLMFIIAFIELGILFLNTQIFYHNGIGSLYIKIASILLLSWLGILLGFYTWSIYFYNINLGLTNEDWDTIKKHNEKIRNLKALNMLTDEKEMNAPTENPYKEETFGLPPGTVRGTIAITVMIGGLSLLMLSFDPDIFHALAREEKAFILFDKYLEFFKSAFLMMIAFYFGSQSLKYLQTPSIQHEDKKVPSPEPSQSASTPDKNNIAKQADINEEPSPALKSASKLELQKKITSTDIETCAKELQIEPALIRTVLTVESLGGGFLPDGRPKILFEGHVFWKELKKRGKNPEDFSKEHPDIVYPTWTKQFYSKTSSGEHDRLNKAMAIDKEAAYCATSWGLFQILGQNFKAAGFSSVEQFVEAHESSERKQLQAFLYFIKYEKLVSYLIKHDWRGFASRYNGPGYEANQYHLRLEEAYARHSKKDASVVHAVLTRTLSNEHETLGELAVVNAERIVFTCKTLELPWKENQTNISCIPKGKYKVQKRFSEKHQHHFHVMDVPERNWILIHTGNYYAQIQGCILVGMAHVDINKDGVLDVSNSRETLKKLTQILPDEFILEIRESLSK